MLVWAGLKIVGFLAHKTVPQILVSSICKYAQAVSRYIWGRKIQRQRRQHTATHCNTLQHTATHCNTLQHTATHCNTHLESKNELLLPFANDLRAWMSSIWEIRWVYLTFVCECLLSEKFDRCLIYFRISTPDVYGTRLRLRFVCDCLVFVDLDRYLRILIGYWQFLPQMYAEPVCERHLLMKARWTLSLPQTSRANPVQCCSTHQKKTFVDESLSQTGTTYICDRNSQISQIPIKFFKHIWEIDMYTFICWNNILNSEQTFENLCLRFKISADIWKFLLALAKYLPDTSKMDILRSDNIYNIPTQMWFLFWREYSVILLL